MKSIRNIVAVVICGIGLFHIFILMPSLPEYPESKIIRMLMSAAASFFFTMIALFVSSLNRNN